MAKHSVARSIRRTCGVCGTEFITGSSIKVHCSPECRVRSAASAFLASDACWLWPGSVNPQTGYGQLSEWADGRRVLWTAHRVSFRAFVGEIPGGKEICHSCDTRACFNPKHLFAGTHQDNMQDMVTKGRFRKPAVKPVPWQHIHPELVPRGAAHHLVRNGAGCLPRGAAHHGARVSESDVRAIRASGETLKALSERYGLTQSTLSSIRTRKTWRHVL